MTERELIPDSELEKKYLAGQLMKDLTEEDGYSLTYAVGHPIKNCALGRTRSPFFGEFGRVTQTLWALRNKPEFIRYDDGRDVRVLDVLGIDENGEDFEEQMRKYNGFRSVGSGLTWDDNEPTKVSGVAGTGLVYVPPITGRIREGMLTDVVRSYREKALTIPFDERWLEEVEKEQGTDERNTRQSLLVQQVASVLIPAGLIIPHIPKTKMQDVDYFFWDPAKMTDERYISQAKDRGITPLEDKAGYATQLVREYAPEDLESFERALNRK